MFKKLGQTAYPPPEKPVMIWDGECGFCRYWTIRWQKITANKVDYIPYQEAAEDFPDIERYHFKQASRLIETDGRIYSGPRSAYRTFTYGSKWSFLDNWYTEYGWFRKLSDKAYHFVAKNRSTLFRVTKFLYGSDPAQPRPFWAIYLIVILYVIFYGF